MSKKSPVKAKPAALAVPASSSLTTTTHTLDNGFDIIVQEDHAYPIASVQVWVRTGSIHEEAWTGAGLAHLCEHMLFKGTATRSATEITQAIQALGGSVNAYTSFNRTVYYIEGLAEKATGYMEILADMVQRSRFDPAELEREKEVIRREMAMDNDDAGSAAQHLMQATAFTRHPLRHPIIGYREVFDQVGHGDLLAFVKRHYAPNHCFLVVTGAVDTQAILAAAQEQFGGWQRQPYEPVMLPVEPTQRGARSARKTFPTELTKVCLGWPIPGDSHEDKPVLDVLAFVLASGRSSRLFRELRERQGLAHYVWAGAWSAAECGLFSADVECDPADTDKALAGLRAVIAQLQAKGPTKAELAKAVRSTIASQYRQLTTTRGQAASLGSSWLTIGSLDLPAIYLDAIRRITPAQLQAVAQRYLVEHTSNLVIVEPEEAAAKRAAASKPKVSVAAPREAITTTTLPNGLRLILVRNPRLPLVSVRCGFQAGVLSETDASAGITQVTAQMLMKGTKTRSAEVLGGSLEERGGMLHVNGDAHRLILAADVMKGDETLALDLIGDMLRNATLPAKDLALVKKRQQAAIREEQEDPLTVALRVGRSEIFAQTPFARTAMGSLDSVASLGVAACRTLLKRHATGANGVITIVGDIDPKAMRQQVQKHLGSLPRGESVLPGPGFELPVKGKPGRWLRQLDKEQAVLVIGFRTVGLHSPDSYVLGMIDEACSDMGSRLFNRIREELGLAYYVGAQRFMAYGAGSFYFYVGTDPAKIDLAEKEVLAQIADLAKHGLKDDELERAKVTWHSSWLRNQQGNGPLADILAWDEGNGLGHEHFGRLPSIINAISPKDVKRVAAQYFQAKQAYIVRVMPK